MKPIRNSAKAIIVKDDMLLFTKNEDQFGFFYLLPGGGQESGETIHEALKRECREEISAEVEIGDLKFVREYIGRNHEFKRWDSDTHQIEYMFICSLEPDAKLETGSVPDNDQVGVEWLELGKLTEYRIYPKELSAIISSDGAFSDRIYLGDVN